MVDSIELTFSHSLRGGDRAQSVQRLLRGGLMCPEMTPGHGTHPCNLAERFNCCPLRGMGGIRDRKSKTGNLKNR